MSSIKEKLKGIVRPSSKSDEIKAFQVLQEQSPEHLSSLASQQQPNFGSVLAFPNCQGNAGASPTPPGHQHLQSSGTLSMFAKRDSLSSHRLPDAGQSTPLSLDNMDKFVVNIWELTRDMLGVLSEALTALSSLYVNHDKALLLFDRIYALNDPGKNTLRLARDASNRLRSLSPLHSASKMFDSHKQVVADLSSILDSVVCVQQGLQHRKKELEKWKKRSADLEKHKQSLVNRPVSQRQLVSLNTTICNVNESACSINAHTDMIFYKIAYILQNYGSACDRALGLFLQIQTVTLNDFLPPDELPVRNGIVATPIAAFPQRPNPLPVLQPVSKDSQNVSPCPSISVVLPHGVLPTSELTSSDSGTIPSVPSEYTNPYSDSGFSWTGYNDGVRGSETVNITPDGINQEQAQASIFTAQHEAESRKSGEERAMSWQRNGSFPTPHAPLISDYSAGMGLKTDESFSRNQSRTIPGPIFEPSAPEN